MVNCRIFLTRIDVIIAQKILNIEIFIQIETKLSMVFITRCLHPLVKRPWESHSAKTNLFF